MFGRFEVSMILNNTYICMNNMSSHPMIQLNLLINNCNVIGNT
jgi:hypothetical protein